MELEIERFRRTVTSPFTGQEYQIVKVSQRDLFEHLGLLPLIIAAPVGEELKKVSDALKEKLDSADESKRAERFLLERGVVSPKVWFAGGECPDGHLPYDYMGDDRYWISAQISNFAFGVGEFRMTSFFAGQTPEILDLVAWRYGQRPSSLIPADLPSARSIFRTDLERLWFDVNVALRGAMAEIPKKEGEIHGSVRTRNQARMAAEIAKRNVEEMERDAEGTWNARERMN